MTNKENNNQHKTWIELYQEGVGIWLALCTQTMNFWWSNK